MNFTTVAQSVSHCKDIGKRQRVRHGRLFARVHPQTQSTISHAAHNKNRMTTKNTKINIKRQSLTGQRQLSVYCPWPPSMSMSSSTTLLPALAVHATPTRLRPFDRRCVPAVQRAQQQQAQAQEQEHSAMRRARQSRRRCRCCCRRPLACASPLS